jgi:hypothetical protein
LSADSLKIIWWHGASPSKRRSIVDTSTVDDDAEDGEDGGADDDDVAGSAAAVAAVDIFLLAARKPEFAKNRGTHKHTTLLFNTLISLKSLGHSPAPGFFFWGGSFGFLK